MRIFLTGSTGFVGRSVLAELLRRGHFVNALVRDAAKLPPDPHCTTISGDLFNSDALSRGVAGCDAVIHLVGIIMENPREGITFQRLHVEATQNVVHAAGRAGIRRYVHMSALGTRPDAVSEYHRSKWRAEEMVRSSGTDCTILRPSLIHGPCGEFMQMAARWARRKAAPFLFMPYFGAGVFGLGGAGLLQPVHVDDVARAFVDALAQPRTIGKTYDLAGPDRVTWPQLHRAVARAVIGKPRLTIPIPVWYARLLTRIAPASLLPFNRDQVTMSQEDNTADIHPFVNDFEWTPRAFEPSLREYAVQLK